MNPPAILRAPARWLVTALVLLMIGAAVWINCWGLGERALGAPSLMSGQPGFQVESLADPSGALTYEQVAAIGSAFSPVVEKRPPPCVWYRLTLANGSDRPRHGILGLSNDYILDAALYQPASDGGGAPRVGRSGGSVRWFDRSVPGAKVAFTVELPPRRATAVYLRIHDPIKQPANFFLWNDAGVFSHLTELYKLEYVGYFSLWFGLFIYNAFLYAVLRRRDYLLYLVYMLCVSGFMVTASGISTLLVSWPIWPLRGIMAMVLLNLATFSLIRFSRVFLDTPAQIPGADRWLRRLSWVLLASSLGAPAWLFPGTAGIYEAIDAGFNILALAALPICGLLLFYRRSSQAGIYVLAFLPLAASLVYVLQSSLGMPDGRSSSLPPLCGSALELIFLALALAWRYRLITDESERLRSEYDARLEQEVARHTGELRASNDLMARANREKDRVFSILGHDLRAPARMLSGLSRTMSGAAETLLPREAAALATEIEEACRAQLELLDNLLLWGRAQSRAARPPLETASAADLVTAATAALAQLARRKGISLSIAVEPGLDILADADAVQAVLRNLVGSAVKFTTSGGSVAVIGSRKGDQVEIAVNDTGVEQESDFTLTLCRDLARSSGGDLKISSELRRGTTATLVLPAAV